MSEVKIKPLVWSHRNDEPKHEVSADCAFGRYHIVNRGEYGFGWCRPRCPVAEGFEPTAELAKAAAQAHFDAAIRSALLPDVSGADAVAFAEKDGDEWVVYWPDANGVFEHIRDYPHLHQPDGPMPLFTTPPASDLREVRNKAFREAANLIAEYQIVHTSSGDVLEPRGDGNKHGMAYATAIAALQTEGK